MSDDQFTKLFKYMEKRFDAVDVHIEKVEAGVIDLKGAVAELSGQVRDYHNESIILSHEVDKLRNAILQIARETGIKLAVEL